MDIGMILFIIAFIAAYIVIKKIVVGRLNRR